MEELVICRICLVTNVKMYDLQSYPLNTYFELISGGNLLSINNCTPYACYECAELLKKFYFFKQKWHRSQAILFGLLNQSCKINSSDLDSVDRDSLVLSSNLKICRLTNYTFGNVVDTENIKEEYNNEVKENFITELGCIKEEHDYVLLSPERVASSDDDEPLSVHKERTIKDDLDVKTQDATDFEESELTQESSTLAEPGVLSQSPTLLIKRKRGRPSKQKVLKKKKKTNHVLSYGDDALELEDFITVVNLTLEEQKEELNKRRLSNNYLHSTYQCDLCYKGFIETNAWEHHVRKHSPNAGDIECEVCKFRFKTKRSLLKHTLIHEKKYICKSCSYVSSNTTQAKQHQAWHKGVTYKCKFCEDLFTVWTSYMSHVRIKHPSEFICGICGYSYISKLGLAMHKTMMHKDLIEKGEGINDAGPYCEECDVKFISNEAFKRHMVMSTKHTRTGKISNGCRTCGETFDDSEQLRLHHRKEHARKRPKNYGKKTSVMDFPAKCEHCSDIIQNGRDHWAHFRRMHPDKKYPIQKNYVCDICGKGFRGNAFLVYHKRTHTEERAYKCDQCGKAFFNRTNLQAHVKTHSDTRPYPCSVCLKAFKCKGALDRHFRSHTGQKPYECEICGKTFTQSNSRKLHVATVHFKQSYGSRRRTKNVAKETPPEQIIY